MKAVVFCSHQVALFLLQSMAQAGQLAGVVLPSSSFPNKEVVQRFLERFQVPIMELSEEGMELELLPWLRDRAPELLVANTFPYRLPAAVLDFAPHGAWNFHAGTLPQYRGPLPLFWQMVQGESHAAMSLHRMELGFDAGPIFEVRDCNIAPQDTHATLLSKVSALAPEMFQALVAALQQGPLELCEQDPSQAKYYPRASQKDLIVDWQTMEGRKLERLIRAANSLSQGGITSFRGLPLRLAEAECLPLQSRPQQPAGTIVDVPNDPGLYILCTDSSCLKVTVVYSNDVLCSGERFRSLYEAQPGERFL
ncbi:methionyl-tRNA formyltransferase [Rubritalea marina]|uniref:methionyl-tRNA formyltransferase n=1 Tax=Rubritalea marina TaxID=361055 RepID=UPI00036787E6|nr:formyltransferase family protein [Rubritalea marina]